MSLGQKPITWGALGALTFGLSHGFEAVGDTAFAKGDSGTALVFHLLALALLIGAIACGVMFLRALVRKQGLFGSNKENPKRTAQVFEEIQRPDEPFDPDAALANYLTKRDQSPRPATPPTKGFGRRVS